MKVRHFIIFFAFCFFTLKNHAQQDSLQIETERLVARDTIPEAEYDPLAPARAAFYSAALPGLGQAYNQRYWKIPLVYAGIGTGIYFYTRNNKQYHRYRNAYKRRLAGYTDDEFITEDGRVLVSTNSLIAAQRLYQRNMEISILVSVGFYILNIVDANVDAHLRQFNVSEDLSFKPSHEFNGITGSNTFGISLNYNF